MNLRTAGTVLLSLSLAACQGKSDSSTEKKPAAKKKSPAIAKDVGQAHLPAPKKVWIPKEFTRGAKRFKDPGVYVDGKPIGFLKFGELPVPLPVIWHKEKAAVPFKKGEPTHKIVRQRRYKFMDYFKAMNVDVSKISEVHLYGGAKRRRAVVISGAKLRAGARFHFRFGSATFGKPIPACAYQLADTNCPDNISAVVVYVKKRPPVRKGGYFYDGKKRLDGIPYFGEPLRGGIRIYNDGPLAAMIKRKKLPKVSKYMTKTPDGKVHWNFFGFLQTQGVKTDTIAEAWIIHGNRRVRRIDRAKLTNATFTASAKKGGEILFGDEKIPTKAISLHSKRVAKQDLPVIQKHEREGS